MSPPPQVMAAWKSTELRTPLVAALRESGVAGERAVGNLTSVSNALSGLEIALDQGRRAAGLVVGQARLMLDSTSQVSETVPAKQMVEYIEKMRSCMVLVLHVLYT